MILDSVKLTLRISNTAFDIEIQDLIEACKQDLILTGILKEKVFEHDPLIKRAIIIYCKANFGLDNQDSEKYQKSYDLLKIHLALAGDYNAVE